MKKKTLFKVLPALLIAPLIACCITLYANASEADEAQTFFDTIVLSFNKFFGNNISYVDNETITTINDNEDDPIEFGDYTYLVIDESKREITLCGFSLDKLLEFKTLTSPIEVTIPNSLDIKGDNNPYKVTHIRRTAFQKLSYYSNKISKFIVCPYNDDGTGGYLKTIESGAFQNYYTKGGSESDTGYNEGGTLKDIVLPDSVTSIEANVFMNDAELDNIYWQDSTGKVTPGLPPNLTNLSNKNFNECTHFSMSAANGILTIPDGITNIYELTFTKCIDLPKIQFSNNLVNIGQGAFKDCHSFTALQFPSSLKSIGDEAFLNCYNLNNIGLNEGLQTLGKYCFSNQTAGATSSTKSKLEYINIPESTYNIYEGAFQNSQELKEVVVGDFDCNNGVLGNASFSNCPNLVSITFLWNCPWQIQLGAFKGDPESHAICDPTGGSDNHGIDCRFRPLISNSEFGGVSTNGWLEFYDEKKKLDEILPMNSRLMLIAAFDDNTTTDIRTTPYGNDLMKYLNENNGLFDNATFEIKNKSLNNGVKYTVCITIPDVLKLTDTGTLKSYAETADEQGNRSKGIEFIYDDTNVHQITHAGKEINRPADDGVLIIGNNAIQANSNNTLYVNYRSKATKSIKSNPCIWGHTVGSTPSVNDALRNTSNYLTAEADQMDGLYLNEDELTIKKPAIEDDGPEDEIVNEEKPSFLFSKGAGNNDMHVWDACCFFAKPGGTDKEGKEYSDAKLTITNVTFGGSWTDMSVPDDERTKVEVDNKCQLACVYNAGITTIDGQQATNEGKFTFKKTVSTWSSEKDKQGDPVSYGGSCLFNFGTGEIKNCMMDNCQANLDGGAILNADELTITNCNFSNCTAARFGGAVFDNLGEPGKGGDGKYAIITIDSCTFTDNKAAYGGAIHYRNAERANTKITLAGKCSFARNQMISKPNNIDEDLCMGPDYSTNPKAPATTLPFILDNNFQLSGGNDKIIISAVKPAVGLKICKQIDSSTLNLFEYRKDAYDFQVKADEEGEEKGIPYIVLKTKTTTYNLDADENGHWVEIKDDTETAVASFTAVGTTPPDAGGTIVYTDEAGEEHTLTAKPTTEGYVFDTCTYDEDSKTYTATFKSATLLTANNGDKKTNDWQSRIKSSIQKRNADAKENAKLEFYGK